MTKLQELEARALAVRSARAAKNDEKSLAKRERDLEEEIATDPLLDEPSNRRMKIETEAEFPGWVVFRLPTSGQASRFRHMMWKDSSERGAIEGKAKAGSELALQCLVHPDRETYGKLIAAYATLPDSIAKEIMRASDAEAAAEEKG